MTNVLIVDDHKAFRQTLKSILEEECYHVHISSSGREALDFLRSHPTPLVVLLDLYMPVLNGIQVLHEVAGDSMLAQRHAYILMTAAPLADTPALPLPPNLEVQLLSKLCRPDDLVSLVSKATAIIAHRDV